MRGDRHYHAHRRGVMLTEACVSLALVGMVLAAVSLMLARFTRASDYFLNYRRAQLAAESCVDQMRAGVMDVADQTFEDDAGVFYEIRTSEPDPLWQPLRRVNVRARIVGKHGRVAHYRIDTYVAAPPAMQGYEP